jgi:predicted permease
MSTLLQDLRFGLRMLAKNPGFTAVAVLTLALGIGANTAIFSVVNAVLLRPLPFPRPDRIVQVMRLYEDGTKEPAVSVPALRYWQSRNEVFDHLAAYQFFTGGFNLSHGNQPEVIPGIHVSAGFFQVLGVKPLLGRTFSTEEDVPGGPAVVVMSNRLWRSRFGAAPDLVGKTITMDNESVTVIGIMPEVFEFPSRAELWAPLRLPATSQDPANDYNCIGRLKAGVTRKSAQAQMNLLQHQFNREYSALSSSPDLLLSPLQEQIVGDIRPVLFVLLGAVCFVLLVACVNVANLLLARSAARQKEIAIRTALGAGRARLIRQLLTESILLGLLGGALGLLIAYWGTEALLALAPAGLPRLGEVGIDGWVLGFTVLVSLGTGVLFGLGPAVRVSRGDLNEPLKEGGRGSTEGLRGQRTRSALVASEVALSLVLLVGAGLLIETFARLRQVKPGFDPHNVLTFQMSLSESKYSTPPKIFTMFRQVVQHLQALPGVQYAATVTALPLEQGPDLPFDIEGHLAKDPSQSTGDAQYRGISSNYFRALGIPLLRGRYFTESDTEQSAGVVIINQSMALQYLPNEDPVGKSLIIGRAMGPEWADAAPRQIVGVVGDVKDFALDQPPQPTMFIPYGQLRPYVLTLTLRELPSRWVVRTTGDPAGMSSAIQREVLTLDGDQPLAKIRTMDQVVAQSIAGNQFNAVLLGIFGGLALLLAAIGMYGVISYSVEQRTHDIGIRMALGARTEDVLKLVVGQGMILALTGVGVGLLGSLALTRFMTSMLFGVRPNDPATLAAVSLALLGVALLASYLPARRAAKVDPMVALRYE